MAARVFSGQTQRAKAHSLFVREAHWAFSFIPESSDAEDVKLRNGRRNRDKALLGIFLSSPQPGRLLCIFCALRVPPFLILYFSELWEA